VFLVQEVDAVMKRKTFKELVSNLPPLKTITDDIELPYVFDLLYDIKFGSELKHYRNNRDVLRKLAENGFDVEKWLKSMSADDEL
jgi:hypothetical protein